MKSPFFIPSQALPALRHFTRTNPKFQGSALEKPLRVVTDANVSIHELVWTLRTRREPSARTHFREVVEAGLLEPYAPPQHEEEVVSKFDYLHHRYAIPKEALRTGWQEFRGLIHWIPPRPIEHLSKRLVGIRERAPRDEPYVSLAIQLGAAAIVTHDDDFASADVATFGKTEIDVLRTQARSAATELGILTGGEIAIRITSQAARGAWNSFRRLPPGAQILVGGMALGALVLYSRHRESGARHGSAVSLIDGVLGPASAAFLGATATGPPITAPINERPRALVDFAAIVCAKARKPLFLKEILRRVVAEGFIASAATADSLRDSLRNDPRFVQQGHRGPWVLPPTLEMPGVDTNDERMS